MVWTSMSPSVILIGKKCWWSKLKWQLKVFFLCFCDCYVGHLHPRWPGWCYDPHIEALVLRGRGHWTHSRHHPLYNREGRHRVWSVPRGGQEPPGRLHWPDGHQPPVNRSARTAHLIMGSRHTSKDSSSVQCFLFTFVNSYLKKLTWFI